MVSIVQRARIGIEDRLRFSKGLRWAAARWRVARGGRHDGSEPAVVGRIASLCSAARLAPDDRLMRRIEAEIHREMAKLDLSRVDWSKYIPDIADGVIAKGAVIKPWVGPSEKGVIYVCFDDQWARLMCRDVKAFAARYTLVVGPTWCPPHHLINVAFPAIYPERFFSLISGVKDQEYLPRLSPKYVPVPLYASSWVNPDLYRPRPRDQRDIDIVMISNFGKYKRHHALFRALSRMPRDTKVMLIGQKEVGRGPDTIMAEARLFGVEDRITVRPSVTDEFLSDALCRAKISLILSRREGSCVAVAEAMFADTPVGLLDNAEVGSRAFINESTGRFLNEGRLAEDLTDFLAAAPRYSPRKWVVENISCHRSTRVLNDVLREHALANGQQWTRDVSTFYRHPLPRVLDPADLPWVRAENRYIAEHFGIRIGHEPPEDPAEPAPVDSKQELAGVA